MRYQDPIYATVRSDRLPAPATIIGWDIGGAHVKVACLHTGRLVAVRQYPCALWQGISRLEAVLDQILVEHGDERMLHAVTMTGELADCFSGRDEGVRLILDTLAGRVGPEYLYVFAGSDGFLPFDQIQSLHYPRIASANWLATAFYVALNINYALLVDIGSTTTDIVLIESGQVCSKSCSDFDRLLSGELVYTGIVRTPLVALARQVSFEGQRVPLMAEFFASTADVYRLTRELPEDYDQWPAADCAEKTPVASARRLARMIGRDVDSASLDSWKWLAALFREEQLRLIQDGMQRQLSRLEASRDLVVIGAGIGRFLAVELARRSGLEFIDFCDLGNQPDSIPGSAECAPAVALAYCFAEYAEIS